MDTPRRPHRVSLFAKFTAVILLLGIVPIVLLVTVLQSRMLTEYRASLEEAYQDAIAYSAYSIRVRLDTYTDLSKFCYYYNYSIRLRQLRQPAQNFIRRGFCRYGQCR